MSTIADLPAPKPVGRKLVIECECGQFNARRRPGTECGRCGALLLLPAAELPRAEELETRS